MILAADSYQTNSDLMIACRDLGYIHGRVLDTTYGKGTWWKKWRPDGLTAHDIAIDGVDFRDLPHDDNSFDTVTFDPPYVAVGGRKTSTIGSFNEAYGLVEVPKTPIELWELMTDGMEEIWRVLKPRGFCLFKAMNYVTSGKYTPQAYDAVDAMTQSYYQLHDEFIHLRKPGPQPKRDKQLHARRNYSHLFVLRAVK